MLYLKSRDELADVVELYHRFRVELPSFVTPALGPTSHLRATAPHPRAVAGGDGAAHALVFDPQTASWCYVSQHEERLLPSLRQGITHAQLRERSNGWPPSRLRSFLSHLYQRGLLEVDGRPGLDPKLYVRGPLFRRAYLIEILLTERCNLACRYCYAESAPERAVMPFETLRRTVDLAMQLPAQFLTIQFAGGETFTHFDGFRRAVAYIEQQASGTGKQPDIIVQSNGTLLTRPGVVEFLREHNINVGISTDGPREIDDLTRSYVDGRSSHDDTLRGLEAVRAGGLEVVGTLSVVGRHNVDRAEELLDHFAGLGLVGVRLNPIIRKGRGDGTWDELGITPLEYFEFMKTVTEYIGRTHAFREGNLEHLLRNLLVRTRDFRCMRSPCGAGLDYLVVTPEGDVYPCVHWLREADLRLGNVRELDSLEWAFLNSAQVQQMASRIVARIPQCRDCQWRHLCEGGCALDARDVHGSLLSPSPLCEYYRAMYPFLFEHLARDPHLATYLLPEAEVCRANGSEPGDQFDLHQEA
jgi:radical SAM protein with 4Fe4S-binding SPASM domain